MTTKITTILGIIVGIIITYINKEIPIFMIGGILITLGSLFMFIGTFFVPKKA